MKESHQGNLANLWAVGGKVAEKLNAEGQRFYYRYCPHCGWKLTGKFSTCPRCGADLGLKTCPYCGGKIPKDAKICPRCSVPIEEN